MLFLLYKQYLLHSPLRLNFEQLELKSLLDRENYLFYFFISFLFFLKYVFKSFFELYLFNNINLSVTSS